MRTSKNRTTVLLAVTALLMTLGITGAAANHEPTAPGVITCQDGNGDIWTGDPDIVGDGQGIYSGLLNDQDFNWRLEATCTVINEDGASVHTLEVQGTATGGCEWSVGHDGGGTLGGVALSNVVTWRNVGDVIVLSATHDAHNSDGSESLGVLTAEVQASGGEECTTPFGAQQFTVQIVAEAA